MTWRWLWRRRARGCGAPPSETEIAAFYTPANERSFWLEPDRYDELQRRLTFEQRWGMTPEMALERA